MGQNLPLVSVIILNYNGLEYLGEGLKECLKSVKRTDYPNFEIVFVDNGSVDESINFILKNFKSKIKIVQNGCNLGFAGGFNMGARASKGEYLALLSNDMTVDPRWLNPIVKLMESEKEIGLAGFKRLAYGTKNVLDGIGGDLYLCGRVKAVGRQEIDKGQYGTIREDLDYIGGAMVVRREIIRRVGLFDPDYIIFSEDCDLCYKIRKLGYKTVYVPQAIIWHKGQVTLTAMDSESHQITYMSDRSRIRFVLIHFVRMRVLSTLLIDVIWFFVTNAVGKKALIKAYWWNLKNVGTTLQRRFRYGPSPPFECKPPFVPFRFSSLIKHLHTTFHSDKEQNVYTSMEKSM